MNTTTEILIAAAIVGSTVLQFGTRRVDWRRLAAPLVIVVGFAIYYLKGVPTSGGDAVFTLVGVALGVVFGTLAGVLLGVRRDATGSVLLTAGVAYMAVWIIVFGARLAFVLITENSPSTFHEIFVAAYQHGITELGWTDFFLLQALAMVGIRTLITVGRVLAARSGASGQVGAVALR